MDYELKIEYAIKKNDEEVAKEREIEVDIEDYINCYSDEVFHLSQNYDNKTVEESLYPFKEEYCQNILEKIKGELPKESILMTSASDMVEELDEAAAEYIDEISTELDEDED